MLRHVIAPARCFAQIPNSVIRHPGLSSQAVRLLAWQIALPPGAEESLSTTAQRAEIKKTAFQRAKSELIAEGFVHEWRLRVDGGQCATIQLISNEPLTAQQAADVRDGRHDASGNARLTTKQSAKPPAQSPVQQPTSPSAGSPTVGQPTGRSVGRQPKKKTEENTPNQPSPAPKREAALDHGPDHGPEPAGASAHLAAAEALLRSLALTDRRLALPTRTARNWASLAACWLERGLRPEQIRSALTQGLDGARSPLGALRWRLEHALPDAPPPPAPAVPKPEPRLARMRECRGVHTQPRLFTPPPGSGETHCRDCRTAPATPPPPAHPGTGYDLFRAARRVTRDGRSLSRCGA